MPKSLQLSDFPHSEDQLSYLLKQLPPPKIPLLPRPANSNPFPFFSLPSEVRIQCYTYMLGPPTPLSSQPLAPPKTTSFKASHINFPLSLFLLSRRFNNEFCAVLYKHLTLYLEASSYALTADTMRKLLAAKQLQKLHVHLNTADMCDERSFSRSQSALLDDVLPVEDTVFALAWKLRALPAVREMRLRVTLPREEDRGFWMRYWDGSLVRREVWEVREWVARGLRGLRVEVWGNMCECCREALVAEGKEVEGEVVAVEDETEMERCAAKATTPRWEPGAKKRLRGEWV